jgi:succinate dehydrogenase/fumarate reductase flavoprotein subunit
VRRVSAASAAVRKRVRRLMWERVGILRTREGLKRALSEFEQIASAPLLPGPRNFVTTAAIIARSALWREESRGAHYRLDFPRRDDERWRAHSVTRKGAAITAADTIDLPAPQPRET